MIETEFLIRMITWICSPWFIWYCMSQEYLFSYHITTNRVWKGTFNNQARIVRFKSCQYWWLQWLISLFHIALDQTDGQKYSWVNTCGGCVASKTVLSILLLDIDVGLCSIFYHHHSSNMYKQTNIGSEGDQITYT